MLHSIPMVSTCLKIPDTIFLTLPATISIAPLCTISLWTSVHCAPNNTIKHMQCHPIHYVYNGSIGVSMSSYNYGKKIFLICAFVLQNLFLHFTNQVRKKVMHARIDLTINEYVFFHGKREPEPDPNKQQLDTYFVSIGGIERMDSQNKPLKS